MYVPTYIYNISVAFQVSTAGQQSKKPSTLLSCRRKLLNLPEHTSAIHIVFTEYYFPDHTTFPGDDLRNRIPLIFYKI